MHVHVAQECELLQLGVSLNVCILVFLGDVWLGQWFLSVIWCCDEMLQVSFGCCWVAVELSCQLVKYSGQPFGMMFVPAPCGSSVCARCPFSPFSGGFVTSPSICAVSLSHRSVAMLPPRGGERWALVQKLFRSVYTIMPPVVHWVVLTRSSSAYRPGPARRLNKFVTK